MRITNEITVRVNGECKKIMKEMNISYKSPSWKRDLLTVINNDPNKLNFDMMVYLCHIEDPKEKEHQASMICSSLSREKIPYKRVLTLETYHNIGEFSTEEKFNETINKIR